jgi:branched-chain amino acid transport system substrate-binding protein
VPHFGTSRAWAAGLGGVLLVAVSGCSPSTTSSTSGGSACQSLTLGFIGPFTGTHSFVGPKMQAGVQVAVDEINKQGGVLGCHHLSFITQDDAQDPGDAVPAANSEVAQNIVAFVGPTSGTAAVVQPIADKANIPILMFGGGAEFDKITDPRFYRMSASDSEQADAMVYYAKTKGYTKVALAFGNQSVDQSLLPSIKFAAQKLGITVTASVTFTSGATSFRSEIQNLFAGGPQAILGQVDIDSAATLFTEVRQAGMFTTPWIVSNSWYDPAWFSAVGAAVATGPVYIANPGAGGTIGLAPFLAFLKQVDAADKQPAIEEETMYDAVTTWALGVDEAGSWTEPQIEAGIAKATGSGTPCGSYADCYALIKAGKAIDWQGSQTAVDFDQYHNVYGPFDILHYNADRSTTTLVTLNASQVQQAIH